MKTITRISMVLLLTIFALGAYGSAEAAPGNTAYDLRVKLDFSRNELNVVEKVVYLNRTGASLKSVVFNVSPVHFKAFKLLSAKVDGREADYLQDDVSLEVTLPYALDPGEFVEIEFQFDLNVPTMGGRFGTYDNVMALGNWYPLVALYRDGWDKHPYTPFGDPFNSEVADYDVTIESKSAVEIAHTGSLVKREGNTWQIRAEKVRDFAMAVSDRFEANSVTVDGVKVTAYNQRGHPAAVALYLDATTAAIRWLNKNVGPYPYDSLRVAEVHPGKEDFVGQEYPNVVFISSSYSLKGEGVKSYSGYVIVHEIVHQWFYGLVGNDQLKEPWIDETLATYLAYRVLDWAPLSPNSPSVSPSGQSPVNSTVFDFKDETQYSSTTYGKGTVFMQDAAAILKGGALESALHEFFELYKYKIASSRGLLNIMQAKASTNLNPLIRRYFSLPEYKADTPLKLDVDWPAGDAWTGVVPVGYRSESAIKRMEIDVDGGYILKTSNPTSPISVDVSKLVDGEYVVGITATDDQGRAALAARRIKVSGGPVVKPAATKWQPTPTPSPTPASVIGPLNVQLPDYRPSLNGNISLDLSGIMLGVAGLFSLFVIVVLFAAIQSRRSFRSDFASTRSRVGKGTLGKGLRSEWKGGSTPPAGSRLEIKSVPTSGSSIVAEIVSTGRSTSKESSLSENVAQGPVPRQEVRETLAREDASPYRPNSPVGMTGLGEVDSTGSATAELSPRGFSAKAPDPSSSKGCIEMVPDSPGRESRSAADTPGDASEDGPVQLGWDWAAGQSSVSGDGPESKRRPSHCRLEGFEEPEGK